MKAKLLIFHKHAALVARHLLEGTEVRVSHRHGLLAKDIHIRGKAIHCDREVRSWWSGNVDEVRTKIGKKVAMVRIRSGNTKALSSSFSSSRRNVAHRSNFDII